MNALIIYDDYELAAHAYEILVRAQDRLEAGARLAVTPWCMDLLPRPFVRGAALRDAIDAELIVIAMRHPAAVPPWLLKWLEKWAGRREFQEAALAVFDGGLSDAGKVVLSADLTAFARRHGLDLIMSDSDPVLTNRLCRQSPVAADSTVTAEIIRPPGVRSPTPGRVPLARLFRARLN